MQSLAEEEYSYDVVPYPSHPFRQSHPERLATVGHLFGMKPAPLESCRVLEIGCAAGGNLIPMAEMFPDSTYLGVDLSKKQIDSGLQNISALGLTNIELKQMDCADIDDSMGKFDYIICHGVFSWVATDVQDKILAVCQNHLSENGIAYISYNTYPGWHFRGMIRDMMTFHVRNLTDANRQIHQARALLEFLAKSVSSDKGAYGAMLNNELQLIRKQSDNYLFHEHLEKENQPLYFYEFCERARDYALQYLGESQLSTMWIGNFPKEVAETLERIAPEIVEREQYADFVRNRTFRQTLICHKDVKISRALRLESLEGAYVSGYLDEQVKPGEQPQPGQPKTFVNPRTQQTMATQDPLIHSLVQQLREAFPRAVSFEDLFQATLDKLVDGVIADATKIEALKRSLGANVIHMAVSGIVELQYSPSQFTTEIPEFPKTTAVARMQAVSTNRLTNCRHDSVTVDDLSRHMVPLMDGTRNRVQLAEELQRLVDEGKLVIHQKGEKKEDISMDLVLQGAIDEVLTRLTRLSMFCAS